MDKILLEKIDIIKKLCKQYNVSKLYAFGSILNSNFKPDSDIDFVVKFNDIYLKNYADNFFELKEKFKENLNREIDLIEQDSIKNPYLLEEILKTRELIYG